MEFEQAVIMTDTDVVAILSSGLFTATADPRKGRAQLEADSP